MKAIIPVINRLRIGEQDEISIRIGNYASIFRLAGKVGPLLETDSAGLVKAITEAEFVKGYDTAALVFFFFRIPTIFTGIPRAKHL